MNYFMRKRETRIIFSSNVKNSPVDLFSFYYSGVQLRTVNECIEHVHEIQQELNIRFALPAVETIRVLYIAMFRFVRILCSKYMPLN